MNLLDDNELAQTWIRWSGLSTSEYDLFPEGIEHSGLWYSIARALGEAQAKKIAVKLQAIYNLPDEGMFHKKMGEFIQSLMEEVK